jgi:hypothetical protein
MIGFFIKKSFFDGWDNLFSLVALNSIYLIILIVFIILPLGSGLGNAIVLASTMVGIVAFSVWHSLIAFVVRDAVDYRSIGFKTSIAKLAIAWKPGMALGLVNVLLWFAGTVAIPFYIMQNNFIGLFLASLLFWVSIVVLVASQYFLPLIARRGGTIRANIRIALSLFLDNIGFSFFLALHGTITLVASILMAFLAPGFAGLSVSAAVAVKLRLKKYEWLEATGSKDRKHIPWNELLEEEQELVGKRTLKGMIFPWKEGK